ncbi:hypothetical protein D3C81_1465610 [compost metagenome]
MGVAGDLAQGIAHMPREHLLVGRGAVLGGIEDALANQAAVRAGQACLFLRFTTGDHQPCGDLQFAQHIALLITVRRVFIQVFGRQAGHLIRLLDQPTSIGERRQA